MEWLKKCILTNNDCYKAGRKIKPQGIMIHSTGANNPFLSRYLFPDDGIIGRNVFNNHWNQKMDRNACYHAFLGLGTDGKLYVYQTLPWDHRGWHCGGKGNDTHISLGICESALTNADYFNKVYPLVVNWSAYICELFRLPPATIIDHAEGRRLGIATNHADVGHWFPKHGKSFKTVQADVKKALAPPAPTPPQETPGKAYTIQVGYYHNKTNAEKFLQTVRRDFPDAFIQEVPRRV